LRPKAGAKPNFSILTFAKFWFQPCRQLAYFTPCLTTIITVHYLKLCIMAKDKVLFDFLKNALSEKESLEIKGGRSYVPTNTGSYGNINWDDITIRNGGFASPASSFVVKKLG
jgi:hypothetical protein